MGLGELLEEGGAKGGVAEGFGASRVKGGERAGEVAEGCGAEGVLALEPGMKEAGVEAVAGGDGVDGVDDGGSDPVALDAERGALLDEGAAGSALDYDEGDAGSEGVQGFVERGLVGYLLDFIFVVQEQVYFIEQGIEDAVPVAGGIVVGVEGEGEAGLSELIEELGEARVKGGLEEQG